MEARYKANEAAVLAANEMKRLEDRDLFIENLGWLLSQTRQGVESCVMMQGGDIVRIVFERGHKDINIACDSYAAIIRDVVKQI